MNFKLFKKLLVFLIVFLFNVNIFTLDAFGAEKTAAATTAANEVTETQNKTSETSKDNNKNKAEEKSNKDEDKNTDKDTDSENKDEEKEEFIEHGFKNINGKTYYLVNNEILEKTGWFNEKDENSDITEESDTYNYKYYLDNDHSVVKGWKELFGKYYYFNDKGVMQTGWLSTDRTYYLDKDGIMQTGWQKLGGYNYYFDSYGHMLTRKNIIDGKWYFFNDKGQLQKGFYEYNGKKYYSDDNGELVFDKWIKKSSGQYYVKSDGTVATGVLYLDDKFYTFDKDGVLEDLSSSSDEDVLTVTSLNVGTADCHYIKLPDGKVALIDTGDVSTTDKLVSFLKSQDLKEKKGKPFIDYVVLTHPHSDHIGGVTALLENFRIGKFFIPRSFYDMEDWSKDVTKTDSNKDELDMLKFDYKIYNKAINAIEDSDVDIVNTESGTFIDDNNILKFVNSDKNFTNETADNRLSSKYWALNDNSAIVYLSYGSLGELFTGDIQWNAEKDFFTNKRLDGNVVNVLKAPHHGNDSSSSYDFLSYLKPNIVVIPRKDDIPNGSNPDQVYTALGVNRYYTHSNVNGITINATKDNWTVDIDK